MKPANYYLLAALGIGLMPLAALHAQQQCSPPEHPFFEFQVDAPATAIPDSSHPHPAPNRFAASTDDPGAIIVQFVVDTAGVPIAPSLKMLRSPSPSVTDSVRAAFPVWRFTPSRKGNCRVPQLVQTAVVR